MSPHQPSADPDRTVLRPPADPSATVDASADSTRPRLPDPPIDAPSIPGYRMTSEIAKGGMGKVYAARDLTLDREVAIKTLLPGANAERFVTESKITARLPHPNIPPVHVLGTLPDGTPFLAMKLIHGRTLAVQLKARPSPSRELSWFVQTFEQVAQAVGFAHSRGIIHRDLKPLNVMVGEFGEVQVMDWGLAKDQANPAREGGGSDAAPDGPDLTRVGAVMGTPGYMAPEQARGEAVDARADVFALGSILATILTGRPAFVGTDARDTVRKAANAEMSDVIARLESCGADTELIALAKRCLAADRESRPTDGRAVATEVAVYRAGVEGRLRQAETERAAAVVRAAETRKRQRVIVWSSGGIAGALLTGLVVASLLLHRATTAEGETTTYAGKMREERDAKVEALLDAEQKLGFSQKNNEILGSVFASLDQKKIAESGRPLQDVLRENLTRAVKELDGAAIGDPLVVAQMQSTLGVSLGALGDYKLSLEMYEKAYATYQAKLGADHPQTAIAMHNLADGYRQTGQLDKAVPLQEKVYGRHKATLGPDHPQTLVDLHNLAVCYKDAGRLGDALARHEECLNLQTAKLGADHRETLLSLSSVGECYMFAGKPEKAVLLLDDALTRQTAVLGADHPHALISLNNLAAAYLTANKLDKALPLFERVVKLHKQKLGIDHPETLTIMNNLAVYYTQAEQPDKALPLFEDLLKQFTAKLEADHPHRLSLMGNLAATYSLADQPDKAGLLLEEAVKLQTAKLGADHPDTLNTMSNLGVVQSIAGQHGKAVLVLEEVVRMKIAKLGADHPDTVASQYSLGVAYCGLKQGDKAAPLIRQYVDAKRAQFPKEDPQFAKVLAGAGNHCNKGELFTLAEEMLRECLAVRKKKEPELWTTFYSQSLLGGALVGQKKYADAEMHLLAGYLGLKEREKDIPQKELTRIPDALDRLIALYTATEKADEVKKYKGLRAKYPEAKGK